MSKRSKGKTKSILEQEMVSALTVLAGGRTWTYRTGNETDEESLVAIDQLLSSCGVEHFTAKEFCLPAGRLRRDLMNHRGYKILVPPEEHWVKLGILALLADRVRKFVEGPIDVHWAWRPIGLNKAAGGADQSDHLTCSALDLGFPSWRSYDAGLSWLEHLYETGLFNLSLGLYGGLTIHIGAYSPLGHRRWGQRPR